jgi:hypothetical protein
VLCFILAIEFVFKIEWQEQCGLGQTGTIRQGLRLIHTRIATAASSSSPPASPRHINGDVRSEDAPPSFMITKNADDVCLFKKVYCMFISFPIF